ncbi:FAD-binding oxidoreductase [Chengkuizengella axinellae]|uniref:FAD-binding oxidoreductase n=1 Tax=Chengkuizengella axinellae TaxID=3064388 RepID=A0ABT9IXQ6_9BACL|nr:FAD-binding oxidoreductase [Chengkuizengella sp. 2205SS18-9]MDP5274148.1 FAD-binding oxidoreductase [Chengkuizengella sp. 2205SS18-9]
MKRWNGWGDESKSMELPASAKSFLQNELGNGKPPTDVSLQEAINNVPESRLPKHHLIQTEPMERLRHAVGQSLGDWIAIRSGTIPVYPDGVAFPLNEEEVRELLQFAQKIKANIIPYGGGTSVVGHLSALPGDKPTITVDVSRMNKLLDLDEEGGLAQFQAGIRGPDLEAALQAKGFTLGHFPQSFEYSTLGGWIVTRSAGQQSLKYGRIEQLFVGGEIETPTGSLKISNLPASGAGPNLREFVLGSEGRLGIVTKATVKISSLPEKEQFYSAFFPTPEQGMAAIRQIAQDGIPLSMMRLSLPEETISQLTMAGESKILSLLDKWLKINGVNEQKCMLLYGVTGSKKSVRSSLNQAQNVIKKHKGVLVGTKPGHQWVKNRFRSPYLRESLWQQGYAVDTLETATTWKDVPRMVAAIESSLKEGLQDIDEKVFAYTHLSHIYPHGSSIYTTYLFRMGDDPAETKRRWEKLKQAASEAIVKNRGTISHQHGVGIDHKPYLENEKTKLGMQMIRSLCDTLDPENTMNNEKLI